MYNALTLQKVLHLGDIALASKRAKFDRKWPMFELKFYSDLPLDGPVVSGAVVAEAVVTGPVMIS